MAKYAAYWDARSYDQYLRSDDWKAKAHAAKKRANGRCQMSWNGCRCTNRATEVHHKTYKRIFFEAPDDLMAVCSDCHRRVHKFMRPANTDLQLPLFAEDQQGQITVRPNPSG